MRIKILTIFFVFLFSCAHAPVDKPKESAPTPSKVVKAPSAAAVPTKDLVATWANRVYQEDCGNLSAEDLNGFYKEHCSDLVSYAIEHYQKFLAAPIVSEQEIVNGIKTGKFVFGDYEKIPTKEDSEKGENWALFYLPLKGTKDEEKVLAAKSRVDDLGAFAKKMLLHAELGIEYGIAPWIVRVGFGAAVYNDQVLVRPNSYRIANLEGTTDTRIEGLVGPLLILQNGGSNNDPGAVNTGSFSNGYIYDLRHLKFRGKENIFQEDSYARGGQAPKLKNLVAQITPRLQKSLALSDESGDEDSDFNSSGGPYYWIKNFDAKKQLMQLTTLELQDVSGFYQNEVSAWVKPAPELVKPLTDLFVSSASNKRALIPLEDDKAHIQINE